ncbi:MAG: nitrite reductase small subunit NirD [Actinomycetota bacterium]|nr:nitrite reductase small subunit NirD [Actinomycetota bacterium]
MTVRRWVRVCSLGELEAGRGVAALVNERQVAIFLLNPISNNLPAQLRAVDNFDPVGGANVLSRGIVGSDGDVDYVASPLHKHRFDLTSGACMDGTSPGVRVWPIRRWGTTVEVLTVTAAPTAAPSTTAAHCPYCALQCGMRLRPTHDDGTEDFVTGEASPPLEVVTDQTFPVNRGRLCVKGLTSVDLLARKDRLLHPMVRDGAGRMRQASWDGALDELARRLSEIRDRYGPDAVGMFGSGALTNEKAYLLGKFARVALRTANIDYNGRYCMSSAAAGQNLAFGLDRGLPFPVSDIADADVLTLWGANPADTMPPLMQWLDAQQANGGRLIVVDPRRSATARLAQLHLQPNPGTDLALALGLLHLAVQEDLVDPGYIDKRTQGWERTRPTVEGWPPERVEAVTGIGQDALRQAFDMIARAPASMLLTGRGPEQQSKGTDSVLALTNLMLALGKVGRHGSGYGCITGQGNGQGGREHGQKADQLPGYRSITDPGDRNAVASVWGIDPDDLPTKGLSAVELLTSIGSPNGLRALFVVGSNLAVASPDSAKVTERLAALDCLAVLDAFPNHTTDLADIVLPVTQWAEEEGTMTNLEGRVIRRRQATTPPDTVRSDIQIICGLAARMGEKDRFDFDGPEAVFTELALASAGGRADYAGITYPRLDATQGIFWPCPAPDHPGTLRLFSQRFAHSNGKARFAPVTYRPSAEEPDSDYPLYFMTGRCKEHYNSGAQTRAVKRLAQAQPEPCLQIHPDLAHALSVTSGDTVLVMSRRGSVHFTADVTADIRANSVFAPFHWGGRQAANLLTVAALDPTSRMPEFKVCAVQVRLPGASFSAAPDPRR